MDIYRNFKIGAWVVSLIAVGFFLYSTMIAPAGNSANQNPQHSKIDTAMGDSDHQHTYEIKKTEEEWRKELTGAEYRILRNKGTEMPYINEYYKTETEGIYVCAACGQELFSSETKYHSGSGWPAFYAPLDKEAIDTKADNSMFMTRTEVLCSRCGSHLGHVFEDGPEPTGLRYCVNSVALDLIKQDMD